MIINPSKQIITSTLTNFNQDQQYSLDSDVYNNNVDELNGELGRYALLFFKYSDE